MRADLPFMHLELNLSAFGANYLQGMDDNDTCDHDYYDLVVDEDGTYDNNDIGEYVARTGHAPFGHPQAKGP